MVPRADREVIIVIVEGKAHIRSSDKDWGVLGDRMSVFEKSPPLLVSPNDHEWEVEASTECTVAVCSAPGKRNYEPCLVGPDNINLTKEGRC